MKWDKKRKYKLYCCLCDWFHAGGRAEQFYEKMNEHSVIRIFRPESGPWEHLQGGKKAQAKDRIIIQNPCGDWRDGLSIPKEVAEKFLVLGVP